MSGLSLTRMEENNATHHEENEENPRDAVPVVQAETAMSSGTSLSTSETTGVVRQPNYRYTRNT